VLAFFALVASLLFLFAEPISKGVPNLFYLALYIVWPALLAWSMWKKPSKVVAIQSLVFFLLFTVRQLNHTSWLPHHSPISLSIIFEPTAGGAIYLVDAFALIMCAAVLFLLFKADKTKKL
jgi:hypothetical protein